MPKPTADAWLALPKDVRARQLRKLRISAGLITGWLAPEDTGRIFFAMADALESLEPNDPQEESNG